MIQASDGNLYGTTEFGGTNSNCPSGCGSIFKMTLDGALTTLHSFDGTNGRGPQAALVQGPDGNLYGTTSGGGLALGGCANGCGTIFQITTDGVFTNLHSFSGTDGRQPRRGLTLGRDGILYGTAFSGGSSFGTIFQITTNGVFTRLLAFNASNGGGPEGTLLEGKEDGVFYGTTEVGGDIGGRGTIYKLTISTNTSGTGSLVTLSPPLMTNILGASYTVIAMVTSNDVPRNGAVVNFSIISGPNVGKTRSTFTIAGQASFTYTGTNGPGTDIIRAASIGANATATNIWLAADTVGDGIPDWWRAQYFGGEGTTTNNQSCAFCDADDSGQNNYFKYIPASILPMPRQSSLSPSKTTPAK